MNADKRRCHEKSAKFVSSSALIGGHRRFRPF
jgi:hypothetical protein